MRTEHTVLAMVFLAAAAGCFWAAVALFRQPGTGAGRSLGGVACGLGGVFFAAWAFNMLG